MGTDLWEGDRGVTMFAYQFAKALNRKGIPQGFITMSSGHGGRNRQMASPLSWTSFNGVKEIDQPAFQTRLNELFMQYPNTDIAEKAVDDHVTDVQDFNRIIIAANEQGEDLSKAAPLAAPPFPEAGKSEEIRSDTIPTSAYNWCVSPMTPMAVAGVIWAPSEHNIGYEPALYAAELERGRSFARGLEVVIGADIAATTGAQLGQRFVGSHGLAADEGEQGHEAPPFVVVGILAPTGKPIDRLILTSVESVWDVHGIEHPAGEHARGEDGHGHDLPAGELEDHGGAAEITAILLGYRSPAAAVRLPAMIDRNTAMQSASPARESARLITLFQPAIEALGLFALLLGGAGAFAVFVTLWSAVRGREGDLALLRVMGASRATIFGTVLLEGAIVALLAAVIGLGFAHGLLWLASRSFPSVAEAGIVPFAFHRDEAAIVAGAVLLGMAAALLPAWNVTRNNLAPILDRN